MRAARAVSKLDERFVRWTENSVLRSEEDMLLSLIQPLASGAANSRLELDLSLPSYCQHNALQTLVCCMEREGPVGQRSQIPSWAARSQTQYLASKRVSAQWVAVDEHDLQYAVISNAVPGEQKSKRSVPCLLFMLVS